MSKSASVAEVKAHFSDWIRAAESGEAVVITRHGKPVVALIPAAEMEQLARLRAAGPEKGLAGLAGGWKNSEELVALVAGARRSKPRATPKLR